MSIPSIDDLNLSWKIFGNLLIISLIILANVGGVWVFLHQQDQDAAIVDTAGRQRMLIQKMMIEAHMIGMGELDHRDDLKNAAQAYNRSLTAFTAGNEELGIPPAPPHIQQQLLGVRDKWEPFRDRIRIILTHSPSDPEFRSALDYLQAHQGELLRASDRTVQLYEANFERKVTNLRLFLLGMVLLDGIAIGVILIFSRRRIIRPINRLAADSRAIAEGKLDHQINSVEWNDEIGSLTQSVQTMKERLVSSLKEARGFQEAVDHAGHAIYITNREGKIRYVNPAFEDQTGYSWEEAVGSTPRILQSGNHSEEFYRDLWTTIKSGEVWQAEMVNQRNNGQEYPLRQTIAPIFDDADNIEGFVAISSDISEQKRRERELDQQKQKYQQLLDVAPDAIFVFDAKTDAVVETNQAAASLLGRAQEDICGLDIADLHPYEEGSNYDDMYRETLQEGGIISQFPDGCDVCIKTADGEEVPVEIHAKVFEYNNHFRIQGIFRDLRQQRQHERRLQQLHETTRELIDADSSEEICQLVVDAASGALNLPITGVWLRSEKADDPSFHLATATDSLQDIIGTPIDFAPSSLSFQTVYEENEVKIFDEINLEGEQHSPISSAIVAPMEGKGVLLSGTGENGDFDINDSRFVDTLAANTGVALERISRENELERQNERLEKFASIVSHDLQNPLNIARGRLDLARNEHESEHLDIIADAHERMDSLIEDVLTIARSGQPVQETELIDISSVSAESWAMIDTEGGTLKIEEECKIQANPQRLRQLFENLLTNAVEHGGSDVTIRVGCLPDGFYVEDDGIGIPEEEQELIFEPGYSSRPDGTGFGLNIVKEIVESHGWSISHKDGTDGGTRFEITEVEVPNRPSQSLSEKTNE